MPLQWRNKSGRVWRKEPESKAQSVPRSLTSLLAVCGDLRLLQQRSSHAVNEVTAERVRLVSQSVDQGHCLFRQRDPELVLFLRACRAVGRVEQK